MTKKYLFIGAHPDDIEIGCGGTVSKLVSEGHLCTFIVATNGDQGSLKLSQKELASTRKNEAIQSAKILGVTDIHFLDLPDGLTGYSIAEKINLIEKIRLIKPDCVFIHSSSDHHPDHKIIHSLSINSIISAAGPWFKDASGDPHKVQEIFGFEVWNPLNQYQLTVDITKFIDKKVLALSAHKSQTIDFPYINAIKGLSEYRGAISGGTMAEVFEVIKTKL